MKFKTQLVQLVQLVPIVGDKHLLVGDKHLHYYVWQKETVCEISLNDKQVVRHYCDENYPICPECKSASTPKLKKWNPLVSISEISVEERLARLYLMHELIGEELGISWGIYEYKYFGCNDLTNYLMNDKPQVEGIDSENEVVNISYRFKDRREHRKISFDKIAEFYRLIRGDVFEVLKEPRFMN